MDILRIININTGRQNLIGAVIFSLSVHCAIAGLVLYGKVPPELYKSAYAEKFGIRVSWITLSENVSGRDGVAILSGKSHAAERINDPQPTHLNSVPFDQAPSSSKRTTAIQSATIQCREFLPPLQAMEMELSPPPLAVSMGGDAGKSWREYMSTVEGVGISTNSLSAFRSLQSGKSSKGPVAIPRYRTNHSPAYPDIARRLGYEGTVILSTEVYPDGHVGSIRIRQSSGYALLDKTAKETVRQWTFEPGYRNGVPITMWVDVPVTFRLTDNSVS